MINKIYVFDIKIEIKPIRKNHVLFISDFYSQNIQHNIYFFSYSKIHYKKIFWTDRFLNNFDRLVLQTTYVLLLFN